MYYVAHLCTLSSVVMSSINMGSKAVTNESDWNEQVPSVEILYITSIVTANVLLNSATDLYAFEQIELQR